LFLGENECLQSLWANFDDSRGPFVVIREYQRLRIYSRVGEEFLVTLPISLTKIWSSGLGLILEGETSNHDHDYAGGGSDHQDAIPTPKLLALHHPLDDLTRIVTKRRNKAPLTEWRTDRNLVLLVTEKPSLAVTYDTELGLHSVWHLRKCEEEDLAMDNGMTPDVIGTPMMRHSTSFHHHQPSTKDHQQHLIPLFNTSRISTTTPGTSAPSSQHTTPQLSSRSISFDLKSGRPTPNASSMMSSGQNSPQLSAMAQICRSPSMHHPSDAKSRLFSLLTPLHSGLNREQTSEKIPQKKSKIFLKIPKKTKS
jgi:hypothetical protein